MTTMYRAMELKLCERSYRAQRDKLPDAYKASMPLPRISILRERVFLRYFEKQHQFLAHLAFDAFVQQRLIIPWSLVESTLEQLSADDASFGDESFMTSVLAHGILKPVTDKGGGATDWEFLHLSFQEYFAAKHIAVLSRPVPAAASSAAAVTSSSSAHALTVASIILHHKPNPRWQIVLWFVAGLSTGANQKRFLALLQGRLSLDYAAGDSWNITDPPPARDLFEHTELVLLSRCVEEGHVALEQECPKLIDEVAERLQRLLLHHYQSETKFVGMEAIVKMLRMNIWMNQQDGPRDLFRQVPETKDNSYVDFLAVVQIAFPLVNSRIRNLADSQWWEDAVAIVGAINGPTATATAVIPVLTALLKDEDSDVRRRAADAVRTVGVAAATEDILSAPAALLKDEDSDVRYSAAHVVLSLGPAAATDSFLSALAALLKDENSDVRRSAFGAVGSLGAAAATTTASACSTFLHTHPTSIQSKTCGMISLDVWRQGPHPRWRSYKT